MSTGDGLRGSAPVTTAERLLTLKFQGRTPAAASKPGQWKDSSSSRAAAAAAAAALAPPATRPATNGRASELKKSSPSTRPAPPPAVLLKQPDGKTSAAFKHGRPLQDDIELVQCKQCKKPIPRPASTEHVRLCQRKKQEKMQKKKEAKEAKERELRRAQGIEDDDDDVVVGNKKRKADGGGGDAGGRKSAAKQGGAAEDDNVSVNGGGGNTTVSKKGKKRKADGDAADKVTNTKKKKKDEAKAKAPKAKMPVDVEKQCGVELANGLKCARSLTCKSHSMGAKRGVAGRSLPYDVLLQQYQKKNQAKQQRAAMDANAPVEDEFETTGPVDSDEEKEAVMAAIARARPQPLVPPRHFISSRSKYQHVRLKEALHNALSGVRGAHLFATGASHVDTTTARHHGGLFGGSLDGGAVRSGSVFSVGAALPPDSATDEDGQQQQQQQSHSRRSSVAPSVPGQKQIQIAPPPAARKQSIAPLTAADST